ncbi:hypothetical protein B0H17DRAFT_1131675 [Mycena rosella]|uniref:CCHC-type domain-containing protein n=1 Tax=Mycena rosella TaxID=1033263 RepID=A0AAD7DMG7_MYCRO|nr:hypothetical protein B0H17DRAFT_1131675 [Mycena rosella]
MSRNNVRTRKRRSVSAPNVKTLGEEIAAVNAPPDTTVGDATGGEFGGGKVAARLGNESPHGHRTSNLDLAVKWGLPCNVVQATEDTSSDEHADIPGAEEKSEEGISVFSAHGELPLWNLPAADNAMLRADIVPHVWKLELEEYMGLFQTTVSEDTDSDGDSTDINMIMTPVESWDNGDWTLATSKTVRVEGVYDSKQNKLAVHSKYFPEWFNLSNDNRLVEVLSEIDLPEFPPLDFSVLEGRLQEISNNKNILELLSGLYSPAAATTEDMQIQAAIIESLKDPKAKHLHAKRRVGSSALKLGAVIIKVNTDGEERTGLADEAEAGPSKGKGVDATEKGPEYEKLHKSGRAKKGDQAEKKSHRKTEKVKDNHLKPQHFKQNVQEAFNREQKLAGNHTQQRQWGQKKGAYEGQNNFKPGQGSSTANANLENKSGSKQGSTSGKNSGKNDTKPKNGGHTNKLSKEERDRLRAEGRCFTCKDIGHESRNCPERQIAKGPTLKAGSVQFTGLERKAKAA